MHYDLLIAEINPFSNIEHVCQYQNEWENSSKQPLQLIYQDKNTFDTPSKLELNMLQ